MAGRAHGDGLTILVLTADHGERASSHGMRAKGPMIYRENVDVPLVVTHPDVHGPQTTDAVIGSIDLAPTLLAFAGVTGSALRARCPFLKGQDFSEVIASPGRRSVRDRIGNLVVFSALHASNPLAAWKRVKNSAQATRAQRIRSHRRRRSWS